MEPTIENLNQRIILGEGPHWDPATQSLYYVDVVGKSICKYHPSTNTCTKATTGELQSSIIIPVEGEKDKFVITLDREIAIIHWDGLSDKFELIEKLEKVEPELVHNRFNDGKCDPSGRLWCGTIHPHDSLLQYPPVGSLYSYGSNKKAVCHRNGLKIANGLTWNAKLGEMFFIDSTTYQIDKFNFDLKKGTISNQQPWFTLNKHGIEGIADGMTIDSDGNLWIAICLGGKVIKVDGSKPEILLSTVKLPALQVTSVAFGGSNLDELYVTTGKYPIDESIQFTKNDGCLYRVTGTGVKGLPANNYRL